MPVPTPKPGQENPDLFKWLTDQLPAPEYLTGNKAYQVGVGFGMG